MSLTILRPPRNVWRIARAQRAAVLVDGAAFFRAVREALIAAERSVFILGWDLHSQTKLVAIHRTTKNGKRSRMRSRSARRTGS